MVLQFWAPPCVEICFAEKCRLTLEACQQLNSMHSIASAILKMSAPRLELIIQQCTLLLASSGPGSWFSNSSMSLACLAHFCTFVQNAGTWPLPKIWHTCPFFQILTLAKLCGFGAKCWLHEELFNWFAKISLWTLNLMCRLDKAWNNKNGQFRILKIFIQYSFNIQYNIPLKYVYTDFNILDTLHWDTHCWVTYFKREASHQSTLVVYGWKSTFFVGFLYILRIF